ncbi:hypothetical protein [Isoptericola sp. b408]|uniref:hypothetical protein n=1 Tax=Isoptericola sp. b408 TaxID=3064653 RepID=UPI002713872D|nr:hypothetical protein [Isoptericola sp. b408]MDO8152594.1 hypothetical protein [Isoptericola sp. b408]
MGLSARLWGFALGRPRVLVVAPGATAAGQEVESALLRRGWPPALSPAGADLLVVVGDPGPELGGAVEVLWSQMPAPRARTRVDRPAEVGARLDAAAASLVDRGAQRRSADADGDPWIGRGAQPDGPDHEDHEDHDEHGHGGHGGHGDMEVAGLPMASSAPDRDGLELEALDVTLGPWLPGSPDGLVVGATMQGDVLSGAGVRWADGVTAAPRPAQLRALDAVCRVLVLAGPERDLHRARRARDAVGQQRPSASEQVSRLARDLRGSRRLRWSLRGLPAPQGTDVLDRLHTWCDVLDGAAPPEPVPPQAVAVALEGAELAAARLAVASVEVGPGEREPAADEGDRHA